MASVRRPVVAGRFYHGDARALRDEIAAAHAHPLGVGTRTLPVQGRLRGLIVPHAGYVFSGPVASWAFARLGGEKPLPRRILLLGPKHTHWGGPAAVAASPAWATPLGEVRLDDDLRQRLLASGVFSADDDAHAGEHSLEVMLPFLQEVYGKERLTILPVAIGYGDLDFCRALAAGLAPLLTGPAADDLVVVVSSDFSHETPREQAWRLDAEALVPILARDGPAFYRLIRDEDRSVCGVMPISVFLLATAGLPLVATKLTYATSMDMGVHDHDRGVGYAAVAFEEKAGA